MTAQHLPLELPRLVMRRALRLALLALLAIAAVGLLRTGHDIRDEVDGAMALAGVVARLGTLREAGDDATLAALAALQRERPLRHLGLQVVDAASGRTLLAPAPLPEVAPPVGWLIAAHRWLFPGGEPRRVSWPLARGTQQQDWSVALIASPESERREALAELTGTLLLVAGCIAALLLAMQWNVRRAFRPLAAIVRAIEGIEQRDARAVATLPPMPIRELQSIANAIGHLATSLQRTEDERRRLGRRLMTLQDARRRSRASPRSRGRRFFGHGQPS